MRKPTTRSLLRRAIPAFLLAIGVAVPPAAAERFGDVIVSAPTAQALTLWHGYLDHRVRVANESTRRTHTVRLVAPHRPYSHGECIRRAERTVVVGPRSSATVSLFQPPLPMHGDGQVAVHVDGRFEGLMPLASMNHAFQAHSNPRVCVLLSRGLSLDNLERKLQARIPQSRRSTSRHRYRSGHGIPHLLARSDYEVASWNANWLSYSCFDGIVLSDGDMTGAPGPVREAIHGYVECGGVLVLAGSERVPAGWRTTELRTVKGMKEYAAGFGRVILYPSPDLEQLTAAELDVLWDIWNATLSPWRALVGGKDANAQFAVIESLDVPVRGLFFFLLGFALLVGPVNLVALSRAKRRIWMLWTVPCAALITCAGVFAYFLFSEGVTPTTRVESITLLDEASRHAVTLARTAVYCPLTPAGGLHFDHATEVTPLVARRGRMESGLRRIDWTRDQHLAGGWVKARIPTHFRIRKSEIRRERLQVNFGGENPLSVLNGFNERIGRAVVADGDGRLYECRDVAAGSRTPLVPLDESARATGRPGFLRDIYLQSDKWSRTLSAITNAPATYMAPGTYVALLEGSPFVESGLRGNTKGKSVAVILGVLPADGG